MALSEERKLKRKIVVANERQRRKTDEGIEVIPVSDFLRDLWKGEIID
jgi:predicted AAA+ superfamily ATPase